MSIDELRLEDERALLDSLVKSAGWKVFHAKWSKLLKDCENSLRSQGTQDRDWIAGLVTGYTRILRYPSERIETIDKKLIEKSKT